MKAAGPLMIRHLCTRIATMVALLLPAAVQAASAVAPGAPVQPLSTLWDLIQAGGWPMYVLIGMSVVTVFLTLYFIATLRASLLQPASFIRTVETHAAAGDVTAMRDACLADGSPAARILLAALEQFELQRKADYQLLSAAMEDEGARQASLLWQRIQYILDVAVVAPMMGLLGTVLGMIKSFSGLQAELGSVIPLSLAQGVAQALVATAGGLAVGIPAMLIYSMFRGRVLSLVTDLESTCGRVLRRLCFAVADDKARKP